MDYIKDIEKAIIKDLNKSTEVVLAKSKVEKDSDLIKSISWEFKNGHFILVANDYYEYVDAGRRKGAKMPPVDDILMWMKDNGIRPKGKITTGQLAFLIARSIKINGIKAKNYSDKVVDVTTDIIAEELSTEISEIIVNEIVDAIEKI